MSTESLIKVLVIEDEPDTRDNLHDILEMNGYQAELAASLAEAEAREDWPEIEIVVLDRKLPDGLADDRLEKLREQAQHACFIIVTGYQDLEGAVTAIRHGASDYLLKPVDPELLRLRLEHCAGLREARLTEARLGAIVRDSSDAIISKTPDGMITSWNAGADRLYGYTVEQAIGASVTMLVPEEHLEEWRSLFTRVVNGGRVNYVEVIHCRKDGTRLPISLAMSPIRESCGRIVGVSSIARDLSERRALERQVLEASTREQRRIGQDLHDGLGQELTGLSFLADDLAEELEERQASEAEQARSIARQLSEAVAHAKSLVRGLRPVHLENGGLAVALRELAERTQQVHGITCHCQAPESVALENSDTAMQLYYIAREAVHNAIQHGRAQRIDIELTEQDTQLTLTVRDDGVGLPPDEHRKTGSGLDIMAYRAKLIDASFELISPDGGGTVMQCVLQTEASLQAE